MKRLLREGWLVRPLFIFICLALIFPPALLDELPYLCNKNGGFLFLVILAVLWGAYGFPLIGIEITLGHFLRGPVGLYGAFPILRSFGWATVFFQLIYSPQIAFKTALHGYYLYLTAFGKYHKEVETCKNPWNTRQCCSVTEFTMQVNGTPIVPEKSCIMPTSIVEHLAHLLENNASAVIDRNPIESPHIEPYQITVPIAIAVGVTMILVFLFLSFGPVTLGVLGSFSTMGIVGCFIALGLKFANLPGAERGRINGINVSDTTKISDAKIWGEAAMFLKKIGAIGMGAWPTLASFNWPSSHWWNLIDLVLLSVCLFGAMIGVAMFAFSVQGYLTFLTKTPFKKFGLHADRRLSLTLYTVPVAISTLPPTEVRLWSAIFYLANFLLGLTTLTVMVEVINTSLVCILEYSMNLSRLYIYRPLIALLTAAMLTALTLLFTCKNSGYGAYLFAVEYSPRLIIAFVFIELLIFIAYMTMKLVKSNRQAKLFVQFLLLALLVFLVFIVLLGTILFLTFDILRNQPMDKLRPERSQAGWILASVPLCIAGAGLVFTVLGSIAYAAINSRSLTHVLCHPRLPREPLLAYQNDISVHGNGTQEYGQFDMGPLRP